MVPSIDVFPLKLSAHFLSCVPHALFISSSILSHN